MFIKGPPENKGFTWCSKEGGPNKWWTTNEAKGLKFIERYVLNLGYESCMYYIFMRNLQNQVKNSKNLK